MFGYKILKNNAGILLCGDYLMFKSLQEVVYEVNDASALIKNKEGHFMALAYDARKAHEGVRQVLQPPPYMPEIGVRYGVEMLWPVVLVQCRMMRASLAWFDSTKRQQAVTYALESVLEYAIEEVFGHDSKVIIGRWYRIDPSHRGLEGKLNSRGAQFSKWTKPERRKNLSGLLASFDDMYMSSYEHWIKQGETGILSPDEYEALNHEEWVDPKW
jgi:hypothetical protein